MKRTFKGGIHPYEGKSLTKDLDVKVYVPKGDMVYPLSQHIGAPAKAIVKRGDRVLAGQLIGEAGGFVSANVHASVSGTVKAVEPRLTASGSKVLSVILENDNQFEEIAYVPNVKPLSGLTAEEILTAVRNAGIVGMGGAGFPTHVKLSPKNADAIDRIIVNASECEPYLTSDYRRLIDEPEKIIEGLQIILTLFPKAKGIIAVEDNKPEAIAKLRGLLASDSDITVLSMKTKYPEGAERQLIDATTGRKLNSKMLPADVGCIVQNVDTVHAIYEAVRLGKPLTKRMVTVTGDAITNPCNYLVPIGTSFGELIEAADGYLQDPAKLLAGGPMMGKAIYDTGIPVTKSTSAIVCLTKDEASEYEPSNCIRCGRCLSACPEHLMPNRLATLAAQDDFAEFERLSGTECMECGCCSYVCPAKRHLTQSIAGMKKVVLMRKKEEVSQRGTGK